MSKSIISIPRLDCSVHGPYDCLFKGAWVVNHDGVFNADIGVYEGRIAAIGDLDNHEAVEVINCHGLHILPGVIDSQVHFREPGGEYKEDMESGARSAVLGGVTSVFEMPNTAPLTVDAESLADKVRRARHRMHCDFAFWVGGTRENAVHVAELERLPGAAGIKVFMGSSTGDLLLDDDVSILKLLQNSRRRVAFHSEDEARLKARLPLQVVNDVCSHPIWRDEKVALQATQRLVHLARQAGALIHVLHISTAEEIVFLKEHKDIATLEATQHHLTLSADYYQCLGTLAQMNPPVRESRHRDGLWYGIQQGIVDVLGSDHAPHRLEEKAKPYPASPSGMTGVQTTVPIMLDHVNAGRLSLLRFVDLTSHGPQRVFGIKGKGRLAVGYDADLTIVDLKHEAVLENSQMATKVGWTPYNGKRVKGWPVGTIIRGKRVMWEGELITPSIGEPIAFY
ncbi:dihydroorotase [Bartonella sp. DGB2]|uniref:dihydroorotase n=1 Tax=Bartonella sp. DGB2 TaxID=3388426 RepID=UPI003990100B